MGRESDGGAQPLLLSTLICALPRKRGGRRTTCPLRTQLLWAFPSQLLSLPPLLRDDIEWRVH